ncbi:MAG: HEPN domain-containing protein [Phycisphaerae bacterium]
MKPLTREWIDKAEGDWATVVRECRARKHPSYDGACFHAQQCAEKYLKGLLCELGIDFRKTHDCVELLTMLLPRYPAWSVFGPDMKMLTG